MGDPVYDNMSPEQRGYNAEPGNAGKVNTAPLMAPDPHSPFSSLYGNELFKGIAGARTPGLSGDWLNDWNNNKGEWIRYIGDSAGDESQLDLNSLMTAIESIDPTKGIDSNEQRRLLSLIDTNIGAFMDNDAGGRNQIDNFNYQKGKIEQIRDYIDRMTPTDASYLPKQAPAPAPKPVPVSAPTVVAPENNLMTPGVGETTQKEMAPEFKQPWEVEKLYADPATQAALKNPGTAETTNNNLIASLGGGDYGAMMKALGLGADAGLGAYYDNAHRRASELINQQMAARGGYGSSTAGDLIQESNTNLEADRAQKEAAYALQRAAEGRGWAGQLGTAANSSQAAQLQRTNQAFNAAGNADTSHLNRLNGGFNQAEGAQKLQISRLGTMFDNALGLGQATSNAAGNATQSLFNTDTSLVDAATQGKVAAATNDANRTSQTVGAIGQGLVPVIQGVGKSYFDSPNAGVKASS